MPAMHRRARLALYLAAALMLSGGMSVVYARGEGVGSPQSAPNEEVRPAPDQAVRPPDLGKRKCCKVCTKGRACGNLCISRKHNCHQPPGCACDAE